MPIKSPLVLAVLALVFAPACALGPGQNPANQRPGAAPFSGGDTPGLIYTHVTVPLDTNLSANPVPSGDADQNSKHITVNLAEVAWDSRGIGDIAKNHGIDHVQYADLEVFSILGIWTQRYVHVYGTPTAK
ncbi:MAG: hypothetical protein H6825_13030 [Planctomycetes bacterium]|nr:hypothetical protein [Planctomycetota bacterium]